MTNRQLGTDSKVISFMRFPLVVLMLFIHSNFNGINSTWDSLTYTPRIIDFVEPILGIVCPFYFFISGYLFFHEGVLTRQIYTRKLRTRARTLLVPYLLWNTIFLIGLLAVETLTHAIVLVDKPVAQMSAADILRCYYDISPINAGTGIHAPVDIPLWFVRDLMVLVVASPAVYYFVKAFSRLHVYVQACLLLPLVYVMDQSGWWPSMLATSAVFFTAGAYFTINRINIGTLFRRMDVAFLMSIVVAFYYGYNDAAYLMMIFLAFSWLDKKADAGRLPSFGWIANSGFFIYAYHTMLLGVVFYAIKRGLIPVTGELSALACFVLTPVLLAIVGIALYFLMSRFLPRLTALLTGGRL